MPINVTQLPPSANARLEPADVATILAALSPVVQLPNPDDWINVTYLNINVQPDGTGVLNIRFK